MKKDEILSAFQEVIEGPRNVYLDEWVKAGGKVMGYYCSYIPEEIFTAAGFLPYRIRGAGSEDSSDGDAYMSARVCTFVRHTISLALRGEFDFLNGVVLLQNCDHIRRAGDLFVKKVKLPFYSMLSVPRAPKERLFAWYLAELKRLDAGYRFSPDGGQTFPFRGKEVTVPTLAEVVQAFPDICLNLEIKQKEPSLVEALVTFIEEQDAHDRILVGSFHDRMLKEFRQRTGGRVATSAASWEARLFWLASRLGLTRFLRLPYDALQVPPRQGPLPVVDRRFVQAAHRLGIQVHVWTVDESEEMRRLLNLGVDGLMSDRPDLLLDVLRLSHLKA